MRILQAFLLFMACYTCSPERCEGTCVAMDSIASSLEATCTKSADCLILDCQTPPKAKKYGVTARPRIQIYPCETPVKLNIQVHGSFLGSTINENQNFTRDTDFTKRISLFTATLHVRIQQFPRKIRFKFTATFGSTTYTIIPSTDVPIDKSGCEGVASTTPNPLCAVATTTVTTVTTLPTTHTTTPAAQITTETTTGITTGPTETTTGPIETTTGPTETTTGPIETTTGPTETTTGPTGITTGPTEVTTGPITLTIPHVQFTTNSSVVITHNPLTNSAQQVSSGAIGGIVAGIFMLILLISVAITISIVLFLVHRRRAVKYSALKGVTLEM